MTEKIAISGASGFVGLHLTEYLKSKNFSVSVSKGDLLKPEVSEEFLKDAVVLINLVGGFYPPFDDQVKKNVLVLNKLCELAVRNDVPKIIHVSAVAAYGSPKDDEVFSEEDSLNPDTTYALSKKMAEDVLHYYHQNKGLKVIILRPPNVYGPGSDHGVIYNFINAVNKDGKVTIEGDGRQKRDFLFVGDLVRAIDKSISASFDNEIFNITNGKTYNLLEVVKILEKIRAAKVGIIHKEAINSPKNISAGNKKAKKELGWEPLIDLEEGLRLTFKSIK